MMNVGNALLDFNNLNFLSEIAISSRAIYLANYSLHSPAHNHANRASSGTIEAERNLSTEFWFRDF